MIKMALRLLVSAALLSGCSMSIRNPVVGPDASPMDLMRGPAPGATHLPLLQDINHGSWMGPDVHPVIEPGWYQEMWIVGHTHDDILWTSSHSVIFEVVPGRFRPEPTGTVKIPLAPRLEQTEKEEKGKQEPSGGIKKTVADKADSAAKEAAERIRTIQEQFSNPNPNVMGR